MTTDALHYYEQTLAARYERLWRLQRDYVGVGNPTAERLFAVATLATKCDWLAVHRALAQPRPDISFAPPPPAKPSPEGSP